MTPDRPIPEGDEALVGGKRQAVGAAATKKFSGRRDD